MSTPGDESRTDLAWREIVENYGERAVLDEEPPAEPQATGSDAQFVTVHLADPADDEPAEVDDLLATTERFTPPPPPPFPRPKNWQRGAAWAGLFLAPLIGLTIALASIYVNPLIGWSLIGWFVASFIYLVREMPASHDPWDDGSRV